MKTIFCIISLLTLTPSLTGLAQNHDAGSAYGIVPQVEENYAGAPSGVRANDLVGQALPPGGGGSGGPAAPQPPAAPGAIPLPPGYGAGYGASGGFGGGMAGPVPPMSRNGYGDTFSQRLQAIVARAGGEPGAAGEPLLILSSDIDPALQAALNDDMTVMAHILQKAGAVGGPGWPGRAMGVNLVFTPGSEAGRDLYLQGYGAVFILKVPFPLLAPQGKNDTNNDQPAMDSDWEKAKRELQGQPPETALPGSAGEPYREERVTQLKNAILEALKNANNIRGLKSEESVIVCVIGPAATGAGPRPPRPPMLPQRTLRTPAGPRVESDMPPRESETVLTIRATKADIEAFAKDKSDLDAFRKRVKMSTYGA